MWYVRTETCWASKNIGSCCNSVKNWRWNMAVLYIREVMTMSDLLALLTWFNPYTANYRVWLNNKLIVCSFLLQKFRVPQLVRQFRTFDGIQDAVPRSRNPATCPNPEPDQSSPRPLNRLPEDPSIQDSVSIHLCVVVLSGLLPWGFPTKILYVPLLFYMRVTCLAHLIPLDICSSTCVSHAQPM